MAVTASSVGTGDTLETFRQEFNNAVVDLGNLDGAATSNIEITANNSTNETVFLTFVDGATGNQGLESDTALTYNPSSNLLTTGSIVIADAGTIGSSSDTNAIGISSGGVVSITATTANTSASDGALTVAGGLGVAADASIGDDLRLISDSAVLSFGADSDTTLTHTDGSGLTLNSTNKLMFNDASQFIQGASATVLDIAATDEIELTATLIDVVGNLAGSGTGTFAGILKTDDTTEATSTTDGSLQTDGGLSVAKDIVAGDDIKLLSDSSVVAFGADGDVTLEHQHNTGLLINGSRQFQFGDSGTYIHQSADGVLDLVSDTEIEINATTIDVNGNLDVSGTYTGGGLMTTGGNIVIPDAGNIGSASDTDAIAISSGGVVTFSQTPIFSGDLQVEDDLILDSDAAVLSFGEDNEVTLTHVHNTGLLLNSTMQLQFNDASQNINAPSATVLDINATDEIELNATLADVNANLDVSGTYTGGGLMTTGGNIVIPDAGNIGSASDTDAIAIASDGKVTFTQEIVATSLDISGNVDIDGTLEADAITVDGATLAEFISDTAGAMVSSNTETGITVTYQDGDNTIDFALAAAQTTITSLLATDIKIGEDDQTKIDFETADEIHFYAANAHQVKIVDGAIVPATDNDIDLGTSSVEFKDAYFDGTVTADAFAGPINGDLTGTLQTAAQGNVTSLGTLTTLTVDNIIINGTNIGHTSDTDAIAIASGGGVTLTQTLTGTAADFSGVATATTFEPDGDTAAGDNAAIGYTSAEGLILTGQGSTSDVTIKNDADETVISIPTGTQTVQIDGDTTDDFLVIKTTEAGANSAPDVVLYRLSSSPADNDYLGKLVYRGRNDNSQDVEYAQVIAQVIDASDGTEDGRMYLQTKVNGSDNNHLTLDSGGATFSAGITATPAATLLIKNSSGTTLKTINGFTSS